MSKKNGIRPNPGQIQQTFTIPGRTNFAMPIWNTFDLAAGTINQIKRYRLVPRSRLETTLEAVVNTLPAIAPSMTRYKARIYAFWVPDRLYVPELRLNYTGVGTLDPVGDISDTFVDAHYPQMPFVDGVQDFQVTHSSGNQLDQVITFNVTPTVGLNSLLNQIGLPIFDFSTRDKTANFNALDFLAYYDVFRNYFAYSNEDSYYIYKPDYDLASGSISQTGSSYLQHLPLADLNNYYRYQLWVNNGVDGNAEVHDEFKRNVFVSYLDSGSFGDLSDNRNILMLPWSGPNYVKSNGNTATILPIGFNTILDYGFINDNGFCGSFNTPLAGLAVKTYMPDMFNAGIAESQYNNIIQQSLVAIKNNTLNMNDLLAGERLYEYFTKLAATGSRYDEFIRAEFGVDIRKYLDIPTFIKTWSFDVGFAHVTATTAAANQSLGSLAGRGVGKLDQSNEFNFSADEYGSLIFYMTIEPYVSYSTHIDPFLLDLQYSDLYSPSFDRMGLEPLTDGVVYADPIGEGLTSELVYQPVWTKYKSDVSRSFGQLAEDFDYWLVNRRFEPMNKFGNGRYSSYINPAEVVPMFNVSDDYPCPFIVQVGFNTVIKQPMSANSFDTF